MSEGPPAAPPRVGPRAAAVLLCLLAVNALAQGARWTLGLDDQPVVLGLEQWVSGLVALAAAVQAWRLHHTAAAWTALYAILLGTLLGTLGPVLGLDADERRGVLTGAAAVVLLLLAIAFYLRRALPRRA